MGELKQRGQIWWIRYYKNGKRSRREFRQHEGKGRQEPAATARRRHRARCRDHAKGRSHPLRGGRQGRAERLPHQPKAFA